MADSGCLRGAGEKIKKDTTCLAIGGVDIFLVNWTGTLDFIIIYLL